MASGVDTADAFSQEDTLDNLRTRGTCPICKEFYIKPKRLDKCSHVFCLNCIKRHLQANRHVNFPGCPMCRRPILKPLSEINDLEPGRAEEDIVSFVKQYEICGLCDQKENPKLRCSECECLVCENCKPSHSKLKPSHNINFLMQPASYDRTNSKQMCHQHPDMSLDLFCIVCQTMLCSYCERFSHAECRVRCYDQQVRSRFNFGFLETYVAASELRTLQFNTRCLSRFVYLKDFVKEAKVWLENLRIALDGCIKLHKEYQSNIAAIIKDQFEPFALRIKAITIDSSGILKKSETVYADIVKLLENATDSKVAISVLHIEQKVVQIFMRHRKYSKEIRPLKFAFDKGVIFRQVASGYLHEPAGAFAGMFCVAYSEPYDKIYSALFQIKTETNYTEIEGNTTMHETELCKSITVYHDIISLYETIEKEVEPESKRLSYEDYLTFKWCSCYFTSTDRMFFIPNNMYTNKFLDTTKSPMSIQFTYVHTIDAGYVDAFADDYRIQCCRYSVRLNDKESLSIVMKLPSHVWDMWDCKIVTSFTNVLEVPFLFNVTGGYRSRDKTPCLICFIGNRDSVSGLETIMLYFDKTLLHSYGICLNTSIAKFNNISSIDLQNSHDFKSVKNKSNIFSFVSVRANDLFMASYRTNAMCTTIPKKLSACFNPFEKSERIIPVTLETVSLFCSTKTGFYFAKHEHDDKFDVMTIGKMSFSSEGMETEVIFSLQEADVGVPIHELKPLTMVEKGDNEIVVVCAVQNDRSHEFIILWPYKEANNRVEVLEVQCPATVLSNASVVELEMDPDGNIMYVLENQEGQNQSIYTKYFMPK